jgi:cytochrome c
MRWLPFCAASLAGCVAAIATAQAQLRGHGGPVRTVAVSADGQTAISGSFDNSAIRWSLARNTAEQVLRFHQSSVNSVAIIDGERQATGGEDGQIAIWRNGNSRPERTFEGHTAPIVSLARSPDGKWLASASWDRTVRLWPLGEGEPRILEGHHQNVNGVAFTPDGKFLVSASYDLTVRIWPVGGGNLQVVTLPSPINAVAVTRDNEIVAGSADGRLFFLSPDGKLLAEIDVTSGPIISLAASADGTLLAAAGIRGSVTVIDRKDRKILRTLVGPGLPVWSVAFFGDNRTLLTGGSDNLVRRWYAATGDHIGQVAVNGPDNPLAVYAGDRGAEIYKACIACHTLTPDEGNRAGPTLHSIMGRRIGTLPGYNYSEALRGMNIIWTKTTIAELFAQGPQQYTPGTKMPEQLITSPEDRQALVEFLEKATTKR